MRILVLYLLFSFFSFSVANAQLIVNEFSNGPSGSKEYIELAVVGNPGDLIDIRNWIVDDHSGFYGCASGNGIAQGHLRFSNHSNWACVPAGSLILIYNSSDINPAITLANDYTDSNNDGIYVLDIGAGTYLESNTSIPNSNTCNTFGGPYNPSSNWSAIALGNGADVALTVDPNNTTSAFHAVGYGGISGPNPSVYFSGSGSGKNYSFLNLTNDNYSLQANWQSGAATTQDTPGAPNNTANANWLNSLSLTASSDTAQGCAPLLVNFSTNNSNPTNTFSWDFGDGNSGSGASVAHTYTTAGNFTAILTITSPAGCTTSKTVSIAVSASGAVTAPSLTDRCENELAFNLPQGSPAGGTWSGNGVVNNSFDPSIAGVGTHTLTYSISGACGGNDQSSITVQPTPTASFNLLNNSFCENDPVVSLSSGSPAGGMYFGTAVNGNTFSPSTAGAGNFDIGYAVDQNGCSDTAYQSISVDMVPSITWTVTDTFCSNDGMVFIGGAQPSGGVYSASGMNLLNDSLDLSNYTVGSNLLLEYTASNGNCIATEQYTSFIDEGPAAQIVSNNDTILCNGESITLVANGNGNFLWSTGSTNNFIEPTNSGIYWVESSNHCGTAADTQSIEFLESPSLTLNMNDTTICEGDSVLLIATYTGDLVWSPDAFTTDSIWVSSSSTIIATSTNSCGNSSDTAQINVDLSSVEINPLDQTELSVELVAVPSNFDAYNWYVDGSVFSGFEFLQYTFSDFDNYPVVLEVESSNGCKAYDTLILDLKDNTDKIFIPNVFTPNSDGLNDYFRIVGTQPQKFHAAVFNRWGEELSSWNNIDQFWDGTYNGSPCADGSYVLRVVYDERKFIKTITLLR